MNRKLMSAATAIMIFASVSALLPLIRSSEAQSSGPCTKCDTWGQVKTCYGSKPHACCDCQKFDQQ